jgi:hypothetical protein
MRTSLAAFLLILLARGPRLEAQTPSVAEFLNRARNALDNLHYLQADTMARRVLELENSTRVERIEALRIAAAANYPERGEQHRDTALAFLRRLVRLEPDRDMPQNIAWPGLNTLLTEVRSNSFGAIGRPQRENAIAGVASQVSIPVRATKPAWFLLVAIPESGGAAIPLDSGGPARDAILHFSVLDGDKLRLPSGDYHLRFTAIDSAAPADTITDEYTTKVDAPALSLVPIQVALDSSRLLPERTRPAHGRNVAIGVGLGATTVLLATVLRGENPVRSGTSIGASGYVAAAGLTVGAILWGLHDRGAPISSNIEANAQLRESFTHTVRDEQGENDRRRVSYHASITIDPEPRQ